MKRSAQYLKDGRSTNIFCNKHDFSWDKTEVSKLRYNHLHHHQRDNVTKFVVESGKRIFMIYTTKEIMSIYTTSSCGHGIHSPYAAKIRSLLLWYLSISNTYKGRYQPKDTTYTTNAYEAIFSIHLTLKLLLFLWLYALIFIDISKWFESFTAYKDLYYLGY